MFVNVCANKISKLKVYVTSATSNWHGPKFWVSLFTGLDYWTGLLDWTTGLTFDPKSIIKMAIVCGANYGYI